MELDAYKLELVREIINGFNSEASLTKLAAACHLIRNEEAGEQLAAMPSDLLYKLMDKAVCEDKQGESLSDHVLIAFVWDTRRNPQYLESLLNQ